jgi:uncharacterized membrane protein (DUF485 family)
LIELNETIPKIYKSCDLNGIPENRKFQKKDKNVRHFTFIAKNIMMVIYFLFENAVMLNKIIHFKTIYKNLKVNPIFFGVPNMKAHKMHNSLS